MSKKDTTTPVHVPTGSTAIEVFDYEGDEGGGFENQSNDDRKLPMFKLLQSNSPEVEQRKGLAGQWWHSINQTAHDSILIVAATTGHCMVEWVPRDDGGGFRGRHAIDDEIVRKAVAANNGKRFGKLPVPQPNDPKTGKPVPANELVETFEIVAVVCGEDGEPQGMAVIPFKSTAIKSYREFNTQASMFMVPLGNGRKGTVPLFAHLIRLGSRPDKNKQGSFFVPSLLPAVKDDMRASLLKKTDPRYVAAKQLRDQYNGGIVRADYASMTNENDGAPAADAAGESAF